MITEDQHSQLQNAAYQYQHSSFGHPEFEEVMQRVFGDNRTGVDATNRLNNQSRRAQTHCSFR